MNFDITRETTLHLRDHDFNLVLTDDGDCVTLGSVTVTDVPHASTTILSLDYASAAKLGELLIEAANKHKF